MGSFNFLTINNNSNNNMTKVKSVQLGPLLKLPISVIQQYGMLVPLGVKYKIRVQLCPM